MKPGQASRTAVLVCMGRAVAHGASSVERFDDPTALALLPEDARARVLRFREKTGRGVRARLDRLFLEHQSKAMVARTVAIDDAVRAAARPQLVILGAGLDGRAWRMAELGDAIVFEVDHPDSQRDKRARVEVLTRTARDVRFVPVDFTRDSLDHALAHAGHDPSQPTTWIWEGVVMYLTGEDVDATLGVVAQRSAQGSRAIIAYHSPALVLHLVGLIVSWMGEPLRSTFTSHEMRTLLARHGFDVVRDENFAAIGTRLPADITRATRNITHMRIVTADRNSA